VLLTTVTEAAEATVSSSDDAAQADEQWAAIHQFQTDQFKVMDENGDGEVTPEELTDVVAKLKERAVKSGIDMHKKDASGQPAPVAMTSPLWAAPWPLAPLPPMFANMMPGTDSSNVFTPASWQQTHPQAAFVTTVHLVQPMPGHAAASGLLAASPASESQAASGCLAAFPVAESQVVQEVQGLATTRRQRQRLRRREAKARPTEHEDEEAEAAAAFPQQDAVGVGKVADHLGSQTGDNISRNYKSSQPNSGSAQKGYGNGDALKTAPMDTLLRTYYNQKLSRAWAELETDFEVQVLIWESLPRRTMDGGTVLGVLAEGSPQMYACSVIRSSLKLASVDPMLATTTIECAQQQAEWNSEVLSSAMTKAIQSTTRTKQSFERLKNLAERLLTTGRTAETSAQDRTPTEVKEIEALILESHLQESDLPIVRQAFHLPEVTKQASSSRAGKGQRTSDTLSEKTPPKGSPLKTLRQQQSTVHCGGDNLPDRAPINSLQSTSAKQRKFKLKVKNTFLEVETDSDDTDDDCCSRRSRQSTSSTRSSSVPCSGSTGGTV